MRNRSQAQYPTIDAVESNAHAPIAGDDFVPNINGPQIVRISAEGISVGHMRPMQASDIGTQETNRDYTGWDDKPVPAGFVPGFGAFSGLSTAGKILAKAAINAIPKLVKKLFSSLEDNAPNANAYSNKLRDEMDRHERQMRDPDFRAKEQNAIEHQEQNSRTDVRTEVA